MKTAMQELIDELKLIEAYPMSPLVLRMAEDLLEKEKKQIKDAWFNGAINGMGLFEIRNEDEYYDKKFNQKEDKTFKQKSKWTSVDNQKQHIIDIMKADEDDGLYNQNK
jgi:hypothetical protein